MMSGFTMSTRVLDPNLDLDPASNMSLGESWLNSSETGVPGHHHHHQRAAGVNCLIYDFVIEAILMGGLSLFGFVGNTLSMICLSKDKSKTATPFLLISLEVADTMFLVTVLILRVLPSTHTYTGWLEAVVPYLPYVGKFVWPLALIATTGTIYLTILVTVNRYVSVCRPYDASNLCSIQYARKHVVLVVAFSIIYNIPRFFEYEVRPHFEASRNRTILVSKLSTMGQNKVYQLFYGNALYFLVMFLLPLVTLLILNYKLIKALRKTKKKRAQLLSTSKGDHSSKSEDDITLMLIVVVLVFVICQAPALVTQVLLSLLTMPQRDCPRAFFYYERISDLMIVANSALNFIIYCFCSRKFRQILVTLVCKTTIESPEPSHASKVTKQQYRQVPAHNGDFASTAKSTNIISKTSTTTTNVTVSQV